MSKETILEEAKRICVERQAAYGSPEKNHAMTAALWSVYLGITVSPRDVCLLNGLQKVSRDRCGTPKRDNLTDIAGFVDNAGRVAESEEFKDAVDKAAVDVLLNGRPLSRSVGSRNIMPVECARSLAPAEPDPVSVAEWIKEGQYRYAGSERWGKSLGEWEPSMASGGCLVTTTFGILGVIEGMPSRGCVAVLLFDGTRDVGYFSGLRWATPPGMASAGGGPRQ